MRCVQLHRKGEAINIKQRVMLLLLLWLQELHPSVFAYLGKVYLRVHRNGQCFTSCPPWNKCRVEDHHLSDHIPPLNDGTRRELIL